MAIGSHRLRIARAENDLVFDEEGRSYIDLFSAHGATWLGHANPAIVAAVTRQLGLVWLTGALETSVASEAAAAIEAFFPSSHRVAALYSTGMESAEFALRVARVATGRRGVVGFERSMHGKSLATAYLGWDNGDGVEIPGFHRIAFVPQPEDAVLSSLAATLASHPISAVFIEPIQGSGGGHMPSEAFHEAVYRLCRAHGALLVFDEILTGFHRTGPPFCFSTLSFVPDVVLVGKGIGNGFPVSAVVVHRDLPVVPAMLPGSTYSGSPLAAAAVVATLREMRALDLPARVAKIEMTVRHALADVGGGVTLRGRGAMWVVDVPRSIDIEAVVTDVYRAGVCVGYAGRCLRVMPPATIDVANLASGCATIARELRRRIDG